MPTWPRSYACPVPSTCLMPQTASMSVMLQLLAAQKGLANDTCSVSRGYCSCHGGIHNTLASAAAMLEGTQLTAGFVMCCDGCYMCVCCDGLVLVCSELVQHQSLKHSRAWSWNGEWTGARHTPCKNNNHGPVYTDSLKACVF
jgi:hypothetical protein